MSEFTTPIWLSSPHEHGKRVKDAQYTLAGHNFFKKNWLKSKVDGDWGLQSGQAADQARYDLGYPENLCHSQVFGQQLFDFLRTDGKRKKLPLTYLARRKARLRNAQSVKAKALAFAISQVGIEESPPGSNHQKFGEWYGLDRQPWCAIFVTYCQVVGGGDKRVFARSARTAYAYWPEDQARAGNYGLRITSSPEPGDLVVYHIGEGHIGIFKQWVDRNAGSFLTIEGNTSSISDDNGGAVKERLRNTSWCRMSFVSLPS